MHKLATDVSVNLLEDRPGALAKAAEAIANARINIDGYAEIGGTFHLLTKDAAATRRALESAGCQGPEANRESSDDHPAYGHSTTETFVATPWKEFLARL